jgi:hypothetical protein
VDLAVIVRAAFVCAALLYAWRRTEVLCGGVAEGYFGRWYVISYAELHATLEEQTHVAKKRANFLLCTGHYTITQYEQHSNTFHPEDTLGLFITVEEAFDNNHRIVSQKGSGTGRFTFSAADSGEHKLCFAPTNWHNAGSYMVGGQEVGTIRIELDMAIGETSAIESTDKGTMEDLVGKVRDLNGRLGDVRREQVFQRVSRELLNMTDMEE